MIKLPEKQQIRPRMQKERNNKQKLRELKTYK